MAILIIITVVYVNQFSEYVAWPQNTHEKDGVFKIETH